jgi:hypothetical protein
MSKGGGKTQTAQQETTPWIAAQPHLLNIMGRGQQLSMGSGITAANPWMSRIASRASAGSPVVDAAQDQAMNTLSGGYLNPFASGAMSDAMDMAKAKIGAQFSGDNSGSSAYKEWLGRGITNAAMPFASQMFENERGRQMQAAGMAPGLANQDYTDLGQGLQVAQMRDQDPWNQLFNYQKAVAGSAAGTGSSTTQQPYSTNPIGGALGGGIGGAALAKALPSLGLSTPWGFAIGAGLGLLGSR